MNRNREYMRDDERLWGGKERIERYVGMYWFAKWCLLDYGISLTVWKRK